MLLLGFLLILSGCPDKDEKYILADEEYLIGFALHNINDSTPNEVEFSPEELAAYKYQFNYPAQVPHDYYNVMFWIAPYTYMAFSSNLRFGAPAERTYYLKGDNVSSGPYWRDWSFSNYMHIYYLNDTSYFRHQEHYNSEDPFYAIRPEPGQNEQIYFGTSPYVPASIVVAPLPAVSGPIIKDSNLTIINSSPVSSNKLNLIQLNGELLKGYGGKSYLKRNVFSYDSNGQKIQGEHAPNFRIYYKNNLVHSGNLIDYYDEWDHTALGYMLGQFGEYKVETEVSSGYPIFDSVLTSAKFNYNGAPIQLPVLKQIQFSPRFKPDESFPVSVDFENNSQVTMVEMYYTTDIMGEDWKLFASLNNSPAISSCNPSSGFCKTGFDEPTSSNQPPIGFFDGITESGIISGWALDKDVPSDSINVHIYFDGPAGSGTLIEGVSANLDRPDVNQAHGVEGKHGYNFMIPYEWRDGKKHSVWIHAIDANDFSGNSNSLLVNSPKTFKFISYIAELEIPDGNAQAVGFRLTAYTNDGSADYIIRPISLRSVDVECVNYIDRVNNEPILKGACSDNNGKPIEGLKVRFFSDGAYMDAGITNEEGAFEFELADEPRNPEVRFDGTGIFAPSLAVTSNAKNADIMTYDARSGSFDIGYGSPTGFRLAEGLYSSKGGSVKPAIFNNDGLTDLFFYNKETGRWVKARTLNNNLDYYESGTMSPNWEYFPMNLDNDGVHDLFVYNKENGIWFKCINIVPSFSCNGGNWSPDWEIYPLKLNNDGLDDLFLYNRETGVWFAVTNADSGFSYQPGLWSANWLIATADFNNDGLSDIFLYNPELAQSNQWIVTNNGDGFSYASGTWDKGWKTFVAELNGDSIPDIFAYNPLTGVAVEMVYENGAFRTQDIATLPINQEIMPAEILNDERTDFILKDPETGRKKVYTSSQGKYILQDITVEDDIALAGEYDMASGIIHAIDFGEAPPEILSFSAGEPVQSTVEQISKGYANTITLSWSVRNTDKLTLNPGNIDVTGLTSYQVVPASDTIYSLEAEKSGKRSLRTVFVKSSKPSLKMTGLWVGPWYNPADLVSERKTVALLKEDFGANMMMYNLDWLSGNYYNTDRPINIADYITFCQARITEAESTGSYLYWATMVPFEKKYSRSQKLQFLEQLKPCFDSEMVLGIHSIDEAAAQAELGGVSTWSKESVMEGYNLFKEVYPDKLVWYNEVAGMSLEQMQGWDWADIISFDLYVIIDQQPDVDVADIFAQYIQKLKIYAGERDAWFIHQGGPLNGRAPTPNELDAMANLTWNSNLKGLIWWGIANNNFVQQHWSVFGDTIRPFYPDNEFKAKIRQINKDSIK